METIEQAKNARWKKTDIFIINSAMKEKATGVTEAAWSDRAWNRSWRKRVNKRFWLIRLFTTRWNRCAVARWSGDRRAHESTRKSCGVFNRIRIDFLRLFRKKKKINKKKTRVEPESTSWLIWLQANCHSSRRYSRFKRNSRRWQRNARLHLFYSRRPGLHLHRGTPGFHSEVTNIFIWKCTI